jgi:hypothetical protein
MRQKARDFGYLRTNQQIVVANGLYIEIEVEVVDPAFIVVPTYDPFIVFAAPRPGFFVGGAISRFRRQNRHVVPWMWGYSRIDWREHADIHQQCAMGPHVGESMSVCARVS